jgi:DNA recombination protein RmuC
MTAILAVLAAALAFVLYLLACAEGRRRGLQARLEARDAEALQLRAELDRLREEQSRALEALLDRHARELSALRETHAATDKEAREQLRSALEEIARVRDQITLAEAARARVEAELQAARDNLASLDERLKASFTAVSRQALQANNEQFLQLARESLGVLHEAARGDLAQRQQAIDELVKPVRDSLEKVDGKIHELEKARSAAYASLTEQVRALFESQTALRAETGNLVKALRAPAVRGRWGEMKLQRVAEMAGMLEHCDFVQQETVEGDDGRLRPDMMVKLPCGKRLVVDAKAPLAAYLDALEAQDEPSRAAHLASHARQLRNHVAQLAKKAYWDQFEHTPEFVVLFVPNEAVFAAAMEQDPALMEGAFSERVLLASPTTLIALLRAAAFGWRQELLARDAQEIAQLGRDLHKRLGRLVDHFARVGRGLSMAVGAFNETVGSFERMVVPGARKLRDKAAPMDPELPGIADVDLSPRALLPAEPALPPEDAN